MRDVEIVPLERVPNLLATSVLESFLKSPLGEELMVWQA
jgi:hypothetical protein